jgi:hypothetical protein
MRRFVEGVDRGQTTLFPECLEDWIGEDNPVRPKATLAGCSTTYAFIRNPATSSVLSCLVPSLGESQ